MWGTKGEAAGMPTWVRNLGTLLLLGTTPAIALLLVYTGLHLDGSFATCAEQLQADFVGTLRKAVVVPTWSSVGIVVGFSLFQIALIKLVPGPPSYGPITSTGHRPVYTSNGLACYFISVITFLVLAYGYDVPMYKVYDQFGEIMTFLCFFSLAFCLFLCVTFWGLCEARACALTTTLCSSDRYFKAWFAPSTADVQFSGNFFRDYWGGCELYPRIFGIDVKLFTNCRCVCPCLSHICLPQHHNINYGCVDVVGRHSFGMMGWPMLLLCYACKQHHELGYLTDSLFVSVCLQLIYVAKFFLWEDGYMCSIDIMHDW